MIEWDYIQHAFQLVSIFLPISTIDQESCEEKGMDRVCISFHGMTRKDMDFARRSELPTLEKSMYSRILDTTDIYSMNNVKEVGFSSCEDFEEPERRRDDPKSDERLFVHRSWPI